MPRVVVIGSSNTDLTVRLPRLPAPGQTILGSSFANSPGGKGANQAVAARRAGADVIFVTAVGNDDLGQNALEIYRREGIDVSHVKIVDGTASGVALIFVADDGENMIGVASGANHRLTPDDIDRLPTSLFRAGDILLAGLEIPVETAIRALERANQSKMVAVLNPAPVPSLSESDAARLISLATVLTPNRLEAMALAGMTLENSSAEPDWNACADRLVSMGPVGLVITLGARGCLVRAANGIWSFAAPDVEAVDTVGAGDVFNGALAVALAEGRGLLEAAAWANCAAALAVTQAGAQSASPVREAIDRLASNVMAR